MKLYSIDLPGHRNEIRTLALSSDDELLCSASMGKFLWRPFYLRLLIFLFWFSRHTVRLPYTLGIWKSGDCKEVWIYRVTSIQSRCTLFWISCNGWNNKDIQNILREDAEFFPFSLEIIFTYILLRTLSSFWQSSLILLDISQPKR